MLQPRDPASAYQVCCLRPREGTIFVVFIELILLIIWVTLEFMSSGFSWVIAVFMVSVVLVSLMLGGVVGGGCWFLVPYLAFNLVTTAYLATLAIIVLATRSKLLSETLKFDDEAYRSETLINVHFALILAKVPLNIWFFIIIKTAHRFLYDQEMTERLYHSLEKQPPQQHLPLRLPLHLPLHSELSRKPLVVMESCNITRAFAKPPTTFYRIG